MEPLPIFQQNTTEPVANAATVKDHHSTFLDRLLPRHHAAMIIDSQKIAHNYNVLERQALNSQIAPVLKANAYGMGAKKVAPLLYNLGAQQFFVAYLDEAIELHQAMHSYLSETDSLDFPKIFVLNGFLRGCEKEFSHYNFIPVLGDMDQLYRWYTHALDVQKILPVCLHVDTGMARTGFAMKDFKSLNEKSELFKSLYLELVMSHLACSDELNSPFNQQQLSAFKDALTLFPKAQVSLCNSGGVFLGAAYHFDVLRPGIALWGGNPLSGAENPMKPAVDLYARVLEVRDLKPPHSIGYGQTHWIKKSTKVATIALGYADGYPWRLFNKGSVRIGGYEAPIIGRISMDLITVDITNIPAEIAHIGAWAHMIGPHYTIDQAATAAQTKTYELLLNLGFRFERIYTGC